MGERLVGTDGGKLARDPAELSRVRFEELAWLGNMAEREDIGKCHFIERGQKFCWRQSSAR
jgi:hypothetical protein